MVKLLLKRGAAVDIDESSGQSALSRAAQRGHLETCKILLDEGANIDTRDDGTNAQAQDKSDRTALFMAAERGHKAVVKLLLGEGANTEARDKWDRTPIFLAAEHGHETIVKLLLDAGAKVNAKDHWKRTPRYWATVGSIQPLSSWSNRDRKQLIFSSDRLVKTRREASIKSVLPQRQKAKFKYILYNSTKYVGACLSLVINVSVLTRRALDIIDLHIMVTVAFHKW
ncbi:hypothetical protein AARAC_000247 [Aspergillus arachidicola]|uniref:Uncharacterized protein n=1 Tax=Aspergillus arachidicola TaxID=656916 RepID=A0A2G7FN51_9EURO|nr:hypothetical protein AARAC_000247 [Aspergillus arachidicola]